MPDIMAAKRGKDFMSMAINGLRSKSLLYFFCLSIVLGCKPDLSDDPIPFIAFPALVLQLNLPEYNSLRTDGGTLMLPPSKGGVQGFIVYRISADHFKAYERNCSYHPNDACVTVNVDPSNLYMTDPCCNSNFKFTDGTPIGGPAWRPLRQYHATVSGSTLTITDTIVE